MVMIIIIVSMGLFSYFNREKSETIEENDFDEDAYFLGLVRGCDIGCIDYDLRQNNFTWNTTEEEYDISKSIMYKECSKHCLEMYGRDKEE